ncbi:MAG: MFS transporter [Nocardioidaceae bacterium]|nr:MFS transporter [Nocardioidaceae bacterium]
MQPTEAPVDGGYLPHRQILIVLGGLMAGMFLAALDQSIVGTALPRITSDLQGLDKLSWVVTAYLLTSTAATPLWGKISDLYGRRLIFQIAIIVFVAGSLLSGFSSSIEQLIAFRAVQGIGGGGLIALALATIGDIVPPRERGRYGGYMGAVFATSSVLGPVLGGWFADGPGWQWIFWINVPIGIVALVVTSAALKLHHVRREHTIDYFGAALVVGSVTSLLLYTAWAGPSDDYGWLSPYALGLISLALVLAVAFVLVERRVAEPIIPMELFANSVFSTANLYAFIIGIAMFGALIFLPLYLQVVAGMSPTRSGLAMLPIVAGLMTTSITSGQVMSRTGRYKVFPIIGSFLVALGLLVLSGLGVDSPYWHVAGGMVLVGLGLGCGMQIVVTAVQNSVDRRHMGAATSSVTFFRALGGTFGTALFGAILNSRLDHHLTVAFGSAVADAGIDTSDTSKIASLPPPVRDKVIEAFSSSLSEVFLAALPIVAIAFVVSFFIKENRLKDRPVPVDEQPVETAAP